MDGQDMQDRKQKGNFENLESEFLNPAHPMLIVLTSPCIAAVFSKAKGRPLARERIDRTDAKARTRRAPRFRPRRLAIDAGIDRPADSPYLIERY
jgi:hypothetical protein